MALLNEKTMKLFLMQVYRLKELCLDCTMRDYLSTLSYWIFVTHPDDK